VADSIPTPGPWLIRTFPTGRAAAPVMWVTDATPDQGDKFVGQAICSVTGTNPDAAANARLIAAAPAMHDALVNLLGALEQLELDKWPALAVEIDDALAALNDASPPRPPT